MRILWILAVLLLTDVCYAQDAIYTTADGTKIMCTASKSSGSLSEYDNFTDYYTFKELLNLMISLQKIDLQIKTTSVDANSLVELFILNI